MNTVRSPLCLQIPNMSSRSNSLSINWGQQILPHDHYIISSLFEYVAVKKKKRLKRLARLVLTDDEFELLLKATIEYPKVVRRKKMLIGSVVKKYSDILDLF